MIQVAMEANPKIIDRKIFVFVNIEQLICISPCVDWVRSICVCVCGFRHFPKYSHRIFT